MTVKSSITAVFVVFFFLELLMYNLISSVMKETYKNIQVNSIKILGFNIEGVLFEENSGITE